MSSAAGPHWRRSGSTGRGAGSAGSSPTGGNRRGRGRTVEVGPTRVGAVTSGNFSPMRERGIALAFVETAAGVADGDRVSVVVRGRELAATVSSLPFWPVGGESREEKPIRGKREKTQPLDG